MQGSPQGFIRLVALICAAGAVRRCLVNNYRWQSLTDFAAGLLAVAGSDAGEARIVANNLVQANRRGIDSHGLIRLPVYIRRLGAGKIVSPAPVSIVHQTAATALVDGGGGWGAVVGKSAMELAVSKAREAGCCAVAVRNSNHFGYAAWYGQMAIAEGMIGIATTNASPIVTPYGGREPLLGTNPICICAPAADEPPFVYDGATTVVARGKVDLAASEGRRIPPGWGVDAWGRETTDPREVANLLPLGGYKGYDLAVAVDILAGVLAGGAYGPAVGSLRDPDRPHVVSHFFCALNVAAFRDPQDFRTDMDRMIRRLRESPPAESETGVLIAGDPERAAQAERDATGIPLPDQVEADLRRLAAALGVPFPDALS